PPRFGFGGFQAGIGGDLTRPPVLRGLAGPGDGRSARGCGRGPTSPRPANGSRSLSPAGALRAFGAGSRCALPWSRAGVGDRRRLLPLTALLTPPDREGRWHRG